MSRDLRLLPAAAIGWLGCLVGLQASVPIGCVLLLVGLAVTAAAVARLRREPGGRHRRRMHGRAAATVLLTAVIASGLLGWTVARAQLRSAAVDPYLRTSLEAVLRVESEPRRLGDDRVLIDATWLTAQTADGAEHAIGVAVTILADRAWSGAVVGSTVLAAVRVALADQGSAAALLVPESDPEELARPPPVARLVAGLRAGLLKACADLSLQARGLVPGIALGDDRALPLTLEQDLRTVSLTHVTAVSGAHVAMVLGLVLVALARLPRPWRAAVAGVVLACLVVLVHPTASVLRSAAMGTVLLVGLLLSRPRSALPALWTSVIVLLAVDPWLARSFGFVLSVLATAGLLIGAGPVADRLGRWLPRPLAMALAVPVAAQLACMPALALLQPQLPVHGVLANVLAAPAVPPVTVLGLTATLVHPVHPDLASWLAAAAGVATAWIASVATWCAGLPLAGVPWWLAVVVGAVALVLMWFRSRRRRSRPG